jgi:hypothetical protein
MNTNPSKDTLNTEDTVTRSAEAAQELTNRILVGLTSKRSDEEWEHYKERTIELFRQKGLFKNEPTTNQKI